MVSETSSEAKSEIATVKANGLKSSPISPPTKAIGRNTATVINHGDRVVGVDGDNDFITVASECLIDGVVHHLKDQMVQTGTVGGITDIHARAFAHCLEAFEDSDVLGSVFSGGLGHCLEFPLLELVRAVRRSNARVFAYPCCLICAA